ncbi:MAG: hypothetical protein OEW66_10495 [Actinomycetota bacterium]|nr:hypothetical protein [Actinomycetota bacterium]MDH5314245.1 hypothetical protein [Actinomycetota bacterium]
MSEFVLLYHGGSMPETEAEQKQVMDAWTSWFTNLGSAVKDPGNPVGSTKSIAADGAVSDGGSTVTGYSILTAESIDDAVTLAKDCPVLQGGSSITVHETFPVM